MAASLAVTLSPNLPRRTGRIQQYLSVEGADENERSESFSASLPGPHDVSAAEFKRLSQKREENRLTTERSLVAFSRPRSASVFTPRTKARLSLRLSRRGRPGSARFGGRGRSPDVSLNSDASTQQIENTFARIKEQLGQLSEEDQAIKDRLDKLNEEINELRNAWNREAIRLQQSKPSVTADLKPAKQPDAQSRENQPQIPILMVSSSRDNLLISLETHDQSKQEDGSESMSAAVIIDEKGEEEGVPMLCGEESSDSVSDSSSHTLMVVEDENQSPSSSGPEDDVFLSV